MTNTKVLILILNHMEALHLSSFKKYKVVQIWPGQTVTCLHTNSPSRMWTTLYKYKSFVCIRFFQHIFKSNKSNLLKVQVLHYKIIAQASSTFITYFAYTHNRTYMYSTACTVNKLRSKCITGSFKYKINLTVVMNILSEHKVEQIWT
jgi:hypothetical protein